MLRRLAGRIAANPSLYEWIQVLAGTRRINQRIAARLGPISRDARVVDVGGGTGGARELWPADCLYICLDQDPDKLKGFVSAGRRGLALLGDATRMPIASQSLDIVLCKFVSHHIPDQQLSALFAECHRVLRPDGRFVFVDGVWAPDYWSGRLLWRYDRGSHPRLAETLRQAIEDRYDIAYWERFAIFHQYVLCIAAARQPVSPHGVGASQTAPGRDGLVP